MTELCNPHAVHDRNAEDRPRLHTRYVGSVYVVSQFRRVILLDGRRKYEGTERGGGN
jgi:hypothetical protein